MMPAVASVQFSAMTPRERMLAAIAHQPVDRVPTDIWATPEVWSMLQAHVGAGVDVLDALGIDGFSGVGPRYDGPALPADTDYWGVTTRRVDYGTGAYDEQTSFPLAAARTIDDLELHAWPQVGWFDWSGLGEAAAKARQRRVLQAGYMAPFYFHTLLRGQEQALIDPLDDPAFTHHLLDRITDTFLSYHRKLFESCRGAIEVTQVTDDLGSQDAPLISLRTFRTFYRPRMQRLIDLAREFGITVFHHDDGAIRPFLPDLIEMGIGILNPVQHTCPGMDAATLKRDYGAKLCFHGAVENQRILPFGSPEEVRAEVRRCIDTLAADGTGYILAPCHNLQPVTPLANILAMYEEAHRRR